MIHLDIEPVGAVSPQLREYYVAWTKRLVEEGRFRPGLYAHQRNALAIHADMLAALRDGGANMAHNIGVRLWVAAPRDGFSIVQAPQEVGLVGANIWQGRVDVTESWGGVMLRIDANVADSPSPSSPIAPSGSR